MLCVWSALEQHPPRYRDAQAHKARVGNPRTVFSRWPWSVAIPAQLWSPHSRRITPLRPAGAAIGSPPQRLPRDHFNTWSANRLDGRLGRFSRDLAAEDRNGLSGKVRRSTSHASVLSVTMQSFVQAGPHLQCGPGGRGGALLRLGNATWSVCFGNSLKYQ